MIDELCAKCTHSHVCKISKRCRLTGFPPVSKRVTDRIKKIADIPKAGCTHPEHEPPKHIYLPNGVYTYTCPNCGSVATFAVRNPIL